jgi:hypothetical protein
MDHKKSTEKNGEGFSWIQISSLKVNVFMEPSGYDEIMLFKILYFVRDTGLLAE